MFTYILGAVSVMVMCSVALVYILVRYNMVNANSLMTIGASTVMGSLLLPVIKVLFLKLVAVMSVITGIIISCSLFLFMIFCISYGVSAIISGKNVSRYFEGLRSCRETWLTAGPLRKKAVCVIHGRQSVMSYFKYGVAGLGGMSYAPNVVLPLELEPDARDIGEMKTSLQEQKKDEAPPKKQDMEVEAPAREDSLEQCIEKAFDRKEEGFLEGAVLYYRRALNLKPERELAAWIYVEMCAIYKGLGQVERMRELLKEARDLAKPEVLEAIERNVA